MDSAPGAIQIITDKNGLCYYECAVKYPIMNELVSQIQAIFPTRSVRFHELCEDSKQKISPLRAIGLLQASNPAFSMSITDVLIDGSLDVVVTDSKSRFKVSQILTRDCLFDMVKSAIQNNQPSVVM